MNMEGSSGSVWQNSNTSGVSDRNTKPITYPDRNPYSGETTSNNSSGFKKDKDRFLSFSGVCEYEVDVGPYIHSVKWGDVSLRQWLDKPERLVDVFECLHIFKQIVELVNSAHCQGIAVHNMRLSCFVMSSFNHIPFIESASCSDSGSEDSLENGLINSIGTKIKTPAFFCSLDNHHHPQRSLGGEGMERVRTSSSTTAMSNSSCMLYAARASLMEDTEENKARDRLNAEEIKGKQQSFPMKQILLMETSCYTSPEEVADTSSSCASNIYRLGFSCLRFILITGLRFEGKSVKSSPFGNFIVGKDMIYFYTKRVPLFCPFSPKEEKSRTMSSLRYRVLPPQLLLKWPKEASFCSWLLHPEPSSRPTLGELLQSEFLNEQRDDMEECEAAIELRGKIEEQELLLEFLLLIQQRKKGCC